MKHKHLHLFERLAQPFATRCNFLYIRGRGRFERLLPRDGLRAPTRVEGGKQLR